MSTSQKALKTPSRRTAKASTKVRASSASGGERRMRIRPRALGLLLAVLLVAFAATVPARLWLEQRQQLADLRAQTLATQSENADLQAQVQRLRDPAYLDQLARACLGMVRRGETAFVVIPADSAQGNETVPCEIALDRSSLSDASRGL